MAGVYWLGANGNIYWKGADSVVRDMGKPINYNQGGTNWDKGFDTNVVSAAADRIDDPNPPGTPPPTNDVGTGGASKYKDTSASQAATQKAIDANSLALNNGLANVTTKFDRLVKQYQDEYAQNETNFNDQTTSNEQTKASSTQASLLAAAQGGRGMRATLASLGALDGTGQVLSNRAVAGAANADLGNGNRVFDANAKQITGAWEGVKTDSQNRDEELKAARADEEAEVRRTNAEFLRDLYKDMAGYKADAGDQAGANDYTGRMGDLAPQVVTTKAASAPYVKRDIKFEAGKLGNYLGGMNDMTVKTAGGATGAPALNSPLYALSRQKDKELV